ncbi:MAG: type III secretion fhipep protein [Gemmatimonadota bacterium]
MNVERPREVCRALLDALDAAEGRRKRRKRDTTPDVIGLDIKRTLLEAAVIEDPAPETFEYWLLERALSAQSGSGAVQAMALSIFEDWQLARSAACFREWLADGAPSDDRGG